MRYLFRKSHLQKPICLIQDEHLQILQAHGLCVPEVVDQSPLQRNVSLSEVSAAGFQAFHVCLILTRRMQQCLYGHHLCYSTARSARPQLGLLTVQDVARVQRASGHNNRPSRSLILGLLSCSRHKRASSSLTAPSLCQVRSMVKPLASMLTNCSPDTLV